MPDFTITLSDMKFRLSETVVKTGKYDAVGIVRGFAVGELGNIVYVVEHRAQIDGLFMHIYSEDVLESWRTAKHRIFCKMYGLEKGTAYTDVDFEQFERNILSNQFDRKLNVVGAYGSITGRSVAPVSPIVEADFAEVEKRVVAATVMQTNTGDDLSDEALLAVPIKHLATKSSDTFNPTTSKIAAAKARGYTGDVCNVCGSFNTVRTGTCLTCSNCGSNEGCG